MHFVISADIVLCPIVPACCFQLMCGPEFISLERPLGRPRRRWEDNIKMNLQEVGGGGGDWMELA